MEKLERILNIIKGENVSINNPELYREALDNLEDADFEKHYLPEIAGKRAVQIEDGTWAGCWGEGVVLVVVFDVPTENAALSLIEEVQDRMALR